MTLFVISDTHFAHANMLKFTRSDGSPVRTFSSVEEMDETMIANWNAVVRPQDTVYHLGDVMVGGRPDRFESVMSRLMGHKRLILGNHDSMDIAVYRKHFQKILSWRKFGKEFKRPVILCHYPLHPETCPANGLLVHGHIHYRHVMDDKKVDVRYRNVCVEHTFYSPVALETLL